MILVGSVNDALCKVGGLRRDLNSTKYESHSELIVVGSFDGLESDGLALDAQRCARFWGVEDLKGPQLA